MEAESERITHKLWLGTLPSDDPVKAFGGPVPALNAMAATLSSRRRDMNTNSS
jgi:hypothetical protein